ncbi:MAG: helix-turn-helix transcriptional regulator [Elusimicrobiota bacterium]|nr:helix-turn-helix transcriptional regulator [Elusimicrobiota bacterium]
MNTVNHAFGRLLRHKRGELQLSQSELAAKLQWPQTTVSRVEQGQRGVTLLELLAVARACRCSAADLLGELGGFTVNAARNQAPSAQPGFTAGFSFAFASEEVMLAQLTRYGVKFLGAETQPALATLPVEEVLLAALNFSNEPRLFEALPSLVLKNAPTLDWDKLLSGAYTFRLQNRLGMVVAAALQLKVLAPVVDNKVWTTLQTAHDTLAEGRLDHEEFVGPRPKTNEALALLRSRTPGWLSFWHGLGSADLKSFQRYLTL